MGRSAAWAETSVKEKGASYPPADGDPCAGCSRPLIHGERVFKLTSAGDTHEWTCETCLAKPDPEAAKNGMGI